jgi:hypothetical protein
MSNALTPAWQRLDSAWPAFFHGEMTSVLNGAGDRLRELRVLQETKPVESLSCAECGRGTLLHAVWPPESAKGNRQPVLPCPECGPVPIPADSLRRWAIDLPSLLKSVAAAARLRNTFAEVVPGHLWYLGTGNWCDRSHQVYFARFVYGHPRAIVRNNLAKYSKAVLLLPTEASARAWEISANPIVSLESAVSLAPDGLAFDATVVESRLRESGLIEPPTPEKKPVPKRATRAVGIERLTAALVEHLRSARDHAYATRDLGGEAKLLPRPTQKQLAEQLHMTVSEVSRCFSDETAGVLNACWEMALDLGQVMNFRGPIGGGQQA